MNKTEVFLSFKNSDANGNSTKERAMADELYNALANRGIGVFYSNETLSACGAAQYKAEIDNALDEATILIAVQQYSLLLEHLGKAWNQVGFVTSGMVFLTMF